jgi:hypothetical protein
MYPGIRPLSAPFSVSAKYLHLRFDFMQKFRCFRIHLTARMNQPHKRKQAILLAMLRLAICQTRYLP